MSEESILREVVANPESMMQAWPVLADYLEERGDRRGELARCLAVALSLERSGWDFQTDGPIIKEIRQQVQDLILAGVKPCVPLLVNSQGMELALIPPGKFWMGSPFQELSRSEDECALYAEITRPYFLGVSPVTQRQYRQLTGTNPSQHVHSAGMPNGNDPERFPVESVSWDEASSFCATLSNQPEELAAGRTYRLPTEAEWEHACRGGLGWGPMHWDTGCSVTDLTPYFFGNSLRGLAQCRTERSSDIDWDDEEALVRYYQDDGQDVIPESPAAVGSFLPNAFGLYDLHGNISEWCADWYEDFLGRKTYPNPHPGLDLQDQDHILMNRTAKDRQGPATGEFRSHRGGSWKDAESTCRTAARGKSAPGHRDSGIGFRVVCEVARTNTGGT